MSILRATVFTVLIGLSCAGDGFAKEWRRIVPLHSTRDDVLRLLGRPEISWPSAFYYRFSNEIAVIALHSMSCNEQCGLGWNVPLGTVTSIGVIPKRETREHIVLLKGNFKVEETGGGFVYYTNVADGISIEKYKDSITQITYFPARKEDPRRCTRDPQCIVESQSIFDAYGNIPLNQEKTRLDNYLFQMQVLMGRGAIVVYGENPRVRNQLMKRAARSRNYLVKKRGFEPLRLLIVNGGHRDVSLTELRLYSIGDETNRIYLFSEKGP